MVSNVLRLALYTGDQKVKGEMRWIYFKKFELWEWFMFLDKILIFALPSTLSMRVTGYQ